MARRKATTGKAGADAYIKSIIPIEQIHDSANALRQDHPQVTDQEAEFVHLFIQTGEPLPKVAELAGVTKAWAYYHMSRQHVAEYRQAVAIRTLGWDSAAAQATMRSLLTAKSDYIKLEAARDIMDRAGLTLEPAKGSAQPATFVFNLSPMASADTTEVMPVVIEHEVIEQMGPVDAGAVEEGGLKNGVLRPLKGPAHTRPGSQGYRVIDLS